MADQLHSVQPPLGPQEVRPITGQASRRFAQLVERLCLIPLLALLLALVWLFGLLAGFDVYEILLSRGYGTFETTLQRIWFAVVPLTAIGAARLRFGADRLKALRTTRIRPLLPLLMAASIYGFNMYLGANGMLPLREETGPGHGFSGLNWLGIVLGALITWIWMPLFPRISAILAGMFAALVLFALVSDPWFGSCLAAEHRTSESYGRFFILFISPIATLVWAVGSLWLWSWARTGIETDHPLYLLHFAVWSGVYVLALALIGAFSFTIC